MKRVWIVLLLITACTVQNFTSPVTSPLASPLKIHFPTLGKDAKRTPKPRPTRNPHYTPVPTLEPTDTPVPTNTPVIPIPTNTPTPTPTSVPLSIVKGVAQPSQYPPDCTMISQYSWYYNYLWNPPDCNNESVPMIWDERVVGKPIEGTSQWVLGFNEPDLSSQADISPQAAVPLWRQIEQDNPDRLLVAPAVVDPSWLRDFHNAYTIAYGEPPRFDALAVHVYCENTVSGCIDYLEMISDYYHQRAIEWGASEVWLTEFAHLTRPVEFIQAVSPQLPILFDRYAWFATDYTGSEPWAFGLDKNTSLWHNSELTAIGDVY